MVCWKTLIGCQGPGRDAQLHKRPEEARQSPIFANILRQEIASSPSGIRNECLGIFQQTLKRAIKKPKRELRLIIYT